MLIRDLQFDDYNDVFACEKACFQEHASLSSFRKEMGLPLSRFRVVVKEESSYEELLGFYFAWAITGAWELLTIAVHPKAQQAGIGEKLCLDLIALAKKEGAEQINLEVRESNEAAKKLYQKVGFEIVGRRKKYYKKPVEDALLYTRNLEK